jgi:hypothetical protein
MTDYSFEDDVVRNGEAEPWEYNYQGTTRRPKGVVSPQGPEPFIDE